MNSIPQKIYIVGSSGSGKTTLAKNLAYKLNIPHFDMDLIRFPHSGIKRTYEERKPFIQEITKSPKWIADGVYVEWTNELLKKADLIIWLDLPLTTTLPRIIKRFAAEKVTGKDRYGFKSTFKLIRYLIRHHYPDPNFKDSKEDRDITKDKVKKALIPFKDKTIIFTEVSELKEFLRSLVDQGTNFK